MVVHVVILWPWPRQEGPPSAVRLLRKGLLLTEYSFSEKGKGMNPSDRSRRMSGFRGCLASKEPCRMFIWTCLYWLMAYPLLSGGRVSEEEVKAGPFYMPSFGFTTRIAKRILINNFLPSSLFFFKFSKPILFFLFIFIPFFFFFFNFWWILSYIEMNQPWVYMCSPSLSPLPPPSPPTPSRSSQCTRSERLSHASNLGWWSVSP